MINHNACSLLNKEFNIFKKFDVRVTSQRKKLTDFVGRKYRPTIRIDNQYFLNPEMIIAANIFSIKIFYFSISVLIGLA